MDVKLNPDLCINEIDEGKIMVDKSVDQGFFLDHATFALLPSSDDNYVDAQALCPASVDKAEFAAFIAELLRLRILLERPVSSAD